MKKPRRKAAPRKAVAPRVENEEIVAAPLPPPVPPSLRLYRRIAGAFVLLVAVVLAVVLLVSTARATIRIVPQPQTVEAAFLVDVVPVAATEGKVRGTVLQKTFEQAKEFEVAGGEKKEVLGKAGGTVTLVNESSRSQPLVATTRLLSSTGVLFRLDSTVTVPAGGKVEAVVHADQEGQTGDIAADRFTIPGLSTALQTSIYATSAAPMTGGRRLVSVVTQEELDRAAGELEVLMFERAKEELRAEAKQDGTAYGEAFSKTVVQKASDTVPGTEQDRFTVSLSLQVTGVFYREEDLRQLAELKLFEALTDGFELASPSAQGVETSVQEVRAISETEREARLRVELKAVSVLAATHPALSKDALVGQSLQEVKDHFLQAGVAKNVTIEVFPPWMGKIPALQDHVDIVIQKLSAL